MCPGKRSDQIVFPEDWDDIYKAFQENDNPLFDIRPKKEAESLYQRTLELASAPIALQAQTRRNSSSDVMHAGGALL